jgi:hypothetical protein
MTARRPRLDTLKVIAGYLGLSPRMVRRLAASHRPTELRLPLFRLTDAAGANARLYAYVDELEAWEARMAIARTGHASAP